MLRSLNIQQSSLTPESVCCLQRMPCLQGLCFFINMDRFCPRFVCQTPLRSIVCCVDAAVGMPSHGVWCSVGCQLIRPGCTLLPVARAIAVLRAPSCSLSCWECSSHGTGWGLQAGTPWGSGFCCVLMPKFFICLLHFW